jgi:hypothetical protein
MIVNNTEWLTAAEVAEQLGPDITPELLCNWKRRGLIRGIVLTGLARCRLDDLVETEQQTRGQTRPRSL